MSWTRVVAIVRKELRDYRRNRSIVVTMAIYPLMFGVFPLIDILVLPARGSDALVHGDPLALLLGIPAIVPATLAALSVVGERQQGTLEPLLTTPIRPEELLLGKALAPLVPSLAVSYLVYAFFLACIGLFAQPEVARALLRGPVVLTQVVFTPLVAGASIWLGIAISSRAGDARTAQQVGALVSLPTIAVGLLVAIDRIHATLGLALGFAVALLVVDGLGWRIASFAFDRERLVTGGVRG